MAKIKKSANRVPAAKQKAPGPGKKKPLTAKKKAPALEKSEKKKSQPADEGLPAINGSEAAFERHVAEARAVDDASVIVMRADPALAYHNAAIGYEAVMEHKARIVEELPKVDFERLSALLDVGEGLVFASIAAEREEKPDGSTRALVREANDLRRLLITSADALVEAGLLDADVVKKIHQGAGPYDRADDCVALAGVFRKNAARIKGKTAVTTAQIERASEVGAALRRALKPAGASRKKPKAGPESAVALRDKFWTLFVARHDLLWRVGAYLFGRAVDERVPSLLSRASRPKARKPAEKQDAGGSAEASGAVG